VRAELIDDYLRARDDASTPYGVAILAATRADVALLNALVRAALTRRGQLGSTALHATLGTATADDPLNVRTGDLVIVGRNDNQLGLFNGTRGVVTDIHLDSRSLTMPTP
jgi:ATP-dependent exoDNAse (exonuclease V) alpha subunit